MTKPTHRDLIYLILAGVFITNALLGEILGGKLITMGPFVMALGVVAWPVVFITSDLVNEYFGRVGVRNLTIFTAILIVYMFFVLLVGMNIPAASFSPVTDAAFNMVFGQSLWIIAGSLVAFLVSQLVDVAVFWMVRAKTQGRWLWMRATGSTVVSQAIDTLLVLGIAFYLPGVLGLVPEDKVITLPTFLNMCATNYTVKLGLAILLTPTLYLFHGLIDRWLGQRESERLIADAAESSLR